MNFKNWKAKASFYSDFLEQCDGVRITNEFNLWQDNNIHKWNFVLFSYEGMSPSCFLVSVLLLSLLLHTFCLRWDNDEAIWGSF